MPPNVKFPEHTQGDYDDLDLDDGGDYSLHFPGGGTFKSNKSPPSSGGGSLPDAVLGGDDDEEGGDRFVDASEWQAGRDCGDDDEEEGGLGVVGAGASTNGQNGVAFDLDLDLEDDHRHHPLHDDDEGSEGGAASYSAPQCDVGGGGTAKIVRVAMTSGREEDHLGNGDYDVDPDFDIERAVVDDDGGDKATVAGGGDDPSRAAMLASAQRRRTYIRELSKIIETGDHRDELDVDEDRLRNACREAGTYAAGVIGVECWILDDDTGRLTRPNGGYWRNPHLDKRYAEALGRLEDSDHPGYVPADPVMPGVDLVGELWAKAVEGGGGGRANQALPTGNGAAAPSAVVAAAAEGGGDRGATQDEEQPMRRRSMPTESGSGELEYPDGQDRDLPSSNSADNHHEGGERHHHRPNRFPRVGSADLLHLLRRVKMTTVQPAQHLAQQLHLPNVGSHHHRDVDDGPTLIWRDVRSLLEDPDTPKTRRLSLLEEAGFGQAAGVEFVANRSSSSGRECRGIVVYMARATASHAQLSSTENEAYLKSAAELIGAAASVTETRRASVASKKVAVARSCRKFRRNMIDFHRSRVEELEGRKRMYRSRQLSSKIILQRTQHKVSKTCGRCCKVLSAKRLAKRIRRWGTKCLGGDLQIPPSLSWSQSLWTLLGCFVGLLILSTMNEYAKEFSSGEYYLLIGPFGALMTLQYGLTAAPASQPRNAVLGQAIAGAISLSFTYIPDDVLAPWLRRAVGPAFAIATMVKLGIPHPPAGAHSVLYASGNYGWLFYFLVVLGSMVSVAPAMFINNMSDKRQYPTYWGYGPSFVASKAREIVNKTTTKYVGVVEGKKKGASRTKP